MRVILRQSALEDLDRIYAWIAKDKLSAAAEMVSRIRDRISFSYSASARFCLVNFRTTMSRFSRDR